MEKAFSLAIFIKGIMGIDNHPIKEGLYAKSRAYALKTLVGAGYEHDSILRKKAALKWLGVAV
jgi:hypothetical protein